MGQYWDGLALDTHQPHDVLKHTEAAGLREEMDTLEKKKKKKKKKKQQTVANQASKQFTTVKSIMLMFAT